MGQLKPGQAPEHISETRPSTLKKYKERIGYDDNPHHKMCSTCEHYRGPTPSKNTHCHKHQITVKPTARCNDYEELF